MPTFCFLYYSAARIGEVLRPQRKHLLTPEDLLSQREITYLQIEAPKTRRRGARIQYVSVYEKSVILFVSDVWQN